MISFHFKLINLKGTRYLDINNLSELCAYFDTDFALGKELHFLLSLYYKKNIRVKDSHRIEIDL